MQRKGVADPPGEIVHELHERARLPVRRVENLPGVAPLRRLEQRVHSIVLVQVILQRLARPRPVRPTDAECPAVGAQVAALGTVKIAEAHHARGHRPRQNETLAFQNGRGDRSQRILPRLAKDEREARMHEHARVGPQRAVNASHRRARNPPPRVPVVQQRVGLLPGDIDVNLLERTPLQEEAAELGTPSGQRQAHRLGRIVHHAMRPLHAAHAAPTSATARNAAKSAARPASPSGPAGSGAPDSGSRTSAGSVPDALTDARSARSYTAMKSRPRTAIASTAATRATALLTPDAVPA